MVEIFSRGRDPEVEGDDITVVVAVGKKQTRWRMRHCASRLCNNNAHHKRNMEGCSFILLFVCHLSRMPEFVVIVGEEVSQCLYYHYLKWVQRHCNGKLILICIVLSVTVPAND